MERLTVSGTKEAKTDVTIKQVIDRLAEYEDLEEQGKLLIKAYEICEVSKCTHCGHVERRIEEAWIRSDLLEHGGFYRTKEEAKAALKEI